MTPGTILSFIPLLLGLFAAQPAAMQQSVTRLVIQDEVILRVPVEPRRLGPQIDWIEHKAPKCMPIAAIRAALLSGQSQVDFILAGGTRVRAKFDRSAGREGRGPAARIARHRDASASTTTTT